MSADVIIERIIDDIEDQGDDVAYIVSVECYWPGSSRVVGTYSDFDREERAEAAAAIAMQTLKAANVAVDVIERRTRRVGE